MTQLRSIGFTGTIASGKTARCHHLIYKAVKRQLPSLTLNKAEVLALTSVHHGLPNRRSVTESQLKLLKDLAVPVNYLNADLVAHHIYRPGTPCYDALIAHFGTRIVTASTSAGPTRATVTSGHHAPIDRKALGTIVFRDPDQLQALNQICWPHIAEAITETFAACREAARAAHKPAHLFVLEAALLVDMLAMVEDSTVSSSWPTVVPVREAVTDVWMTRCDGEVAVRRVMQRDGLSEAAAKARLARQKQPEETARLLSHLGFTEPRLRVFDTTHTTLAEGLGDIEAALGAYWKQSVAPFVTMP